MKILFQGDSITDAGRNAVNGSKVSIGQGYALMIAGELGARFPGAYVFENRGIGGNRVTDIYARIKADAWNLKPDVFSLLVGVNDVWKELGCMDIIHDGTEPERYKRVYSMLIEDTLEALPGVKFILMEPFLLRGIYTEEKWDVFCEEVKIRAAIVKELAEKYGLAFVPLQELFDKACESAPAEYWVADGVHPTPAGHRLIADEWLKVFSQEICNT